MGEDEVRHGMVLADDKRGFRTLHLFAGAGGGILGDLLLGHECIGAVEIEGYPREVLLARQEDGVLPRFPIWDDVTTFTRDNPECAEYISLLRSIADRLIIAGGFPCQDLSIAGKGAGLDGERSGLWKEMARIIGEVEPAHVFVENSSMLVVRGLDRVLGDLAELGYDATWGVVGADDAGAPHRRKRFWLWGTRHESTGGANPHPHSDGNGCDEGDKEVDHEG